MQLSESSNIKTVFFLSDAFQKADPPKNPLPAEYQHCTPTESLLGGKMGSGSYQFNVDSCVYAYMQMTMITYFCVVIGQNLKLFPILKEKVFFLFTECKLCVRLC